MSPILGYWKIKGLVQPTRLLLEYLEEKYEEHLYERDEGDKWRNKKFELGLEFPNLPYYIDGDVKLTQSMAIIRYIADKHNMLGGCPKERAEISMLEGAVLDIRYGVSRIAYSKDFETLKVDFLSKLPEMLKMFEDRLCHKTYLNGDHVTHPDFMLYDALDVVLYMDPMCLDAFPKLVCFKKRIEAIPQIDKYLKSSKYIAWPLQGWQATFGGGDHPPKSDLVPRGSPGIPGQFSASAGSGFGGGLGSAFGAGTSGLGSLLQAASSFAPGGFSNALNSFANAGSTGSDSRGAANFESSASSGSNGAPVSAQSSQSSQSSQSFASASNSGARLGRGFGLSNAAASGVSGIGSAIQGFAGLGTGLASGIGGSLSKIVGSGLSTATGAGSGVGRITGAISTLGALANAGGKTFGALAQIPQILREEGINPIGFMTNLISSISSGGPPDISSIFSALRRNGVEPGAIMRVSGRIMNNPELVASITQSLADVATGIFGTATGVHLGGGGLGSVVNAMSNGAQGLGAATQGVGSLVTGIGGMFTDAMGQMSSGGRGGGRGSGRGGPLTGALGGALSGALGGGRDGGRRGGLLGGQFGGRFGGRRGDREEGEGRFSFGGFGLGRNGQDFDRY